MSTWIDLLRNDPTPADEEILGLLGTWFDEGFHPPVARRLHFVTCDGISQLHVELTLESRTLSFYINVLDAHEALYSLASTTMPDDVLEAIEKATRR